MFFVRWIVLGTIFFYFSAPFPPIAQTLAPVNPATPEKLIQSELFARVENERVLAIIRLRIKPGLHLYHTRLGPEDAVGKPTSVELTGQGVQWSKIRFPKPEKLPQPEIGKGGRDTWIYTHKGTIHLYAVGKIGKNFRLQTITAKIDGLVCNSECLVYHDTISWSGRGPDVLFSDFPDEITATDLPRDIPETGQPRVFNPDKAPGNAVSQFPDFDPRRESRGHGIFVWLIFAFIAGAILNVMPCVLPLVSIKVLSFVQQAGEDKKRILSLGIAFAAGILIVFWCLALAAIIGGLNWGDQFQSETFKIVLISIIFAFSLSLFGVYEIGISTGSLGGAIQREGIGDAFFRGILATLLATPCSGPFLGSTLAWALTQPPATVFLIFTTMGLGMAIPYVILTSRPALLKKLPKPGNWMVTFKQFMGFLLLATVVYLMISVRQDLLLFTVAFLTVVALACFIWGKYATLSRSKPARTMIFAISALMVVAGGYLIFVPFQNAYTRNPLIAEVEDGLVWQNFHPEKFREYLNNNRNIFLVFTADWCPNCKWNENVVYDSKQIRFLLKEKNVVTIMADMTHSGAKTKVIEGLRKKLGGNAVPFLAVFPADTPLQPYVRHGIVTGSDIRNILKSL